MICRSRLRWWARSGPRRRPEPSRYDTRAPSMKISASAPSEQLGERTEVGDRPQHTIAHLPRVDERDLLPRRRQPFVSVEARPAPLPRALRRGRLVGAEPRQRSIHIDVAPDGVVRVGGQRDLRRRAGTGQAREHEALDALRTRAGDGLAVPRSRLDGPIVRDPRERRRTPTVPPRIPCGSRPAGTDCSEHSSPRDAAARRVPSARLGGPLERAHDTDRTRGHDPDDRGGDSEEGARGRRRLVGVDHHGARSTTDDLHHIEHVARRDPAADRAGNPPTTPSERGAGGASWTIASSSVPSPCAHA